MDVKYIKELKQFIVDGKTINEDTLTEQEKQVLLKESKQMVFLTGDVKAKTNIIV